MQQDIFEITLYDKREGINSSLYVEQIDRFTFRTVENEIFNCYLTLGTEFETRINENGTHEIIRITRESLYQTRRFLLSMQFTESEYRMLGDELIKHGGYWQVDLGNIATINIPKDATFKLEDLFTAFGFWPTEITDD